jgi:hypothetical protein
MKTNEEIKEKIQEGVLRYIDEELDFTPSEQVKRTLCQIIANCFGESKETDANPKRYNNHPEEVYNRNWMKTNL